MFSHCDTITAVVPSNYPSVETLGNKTKISLALLVSRLSYIGRQRFMASHRAWQPPMFNKWCHVHAWCHVSTWCHVRNLCHVRDLCHASNGHTLNLGFCQPASKSSTRLGISTSRRNPQCLTEFSLSPERIQVLLFLLRHHGSQRHDR